MNLSDQARRFGALVMTDAGVLELLLAFAGEGQPAPLAKVALERFGSLAEALAADATALGDVGIDADSTTLFAVVREAASRLGARGVRERPVLTNWQQLIDYCHVAMARDQVEQFRVLYLDRKNCLLADEVQHGTVDHVPVYPREVVRRALTHNASALILLHNHPSGEPKPSRDDIEMTRQVKSAAETLGITLHDHVIIGRSGHASFRSLGLL